MTRSQRTARNVMLVSTASLVQIIVQFLFQRVLAGAYGAGADADALAAALTLPTLFAAVVTGSLSYVLVPELVAKFHADDHSPDGWRMASFVGLLTSLISLVCSAVLWGCAEPICRMLYSTLADQPLLQTSELLRILSVQVLLSGLISWAQAIHHSRHVFLAPALGGVLGTAFTLAWAHRFGQEGISSLAWAINAGSLVSVSVHVLPLLRRLGAPRADVASLWRLATLFWPLLLGAVFLRLDPVIDRVLAARLASQDPGAIAYINYAQRILMALLAIGTSSLAVVAFPQLAQRFEGEGNSGFAEHFSLAFRRLILLVVPMAIGFSGFSVWIVQDLLQQGEFTAHDATMVGLLIVALMGMFVGSSCGELLARGFYVLGDTKTPTLVGAIALSSGLVVKFILFAWIEIWGIALGVSCYSLLSAGIMAWILARRSPDSVFAGCLAVFVQSLRSTLLDCA